MSLPAPDKIPKPETFADLHARIGCVPFDRIRIKPPPGAATEAELVELGEKEGFRCELIAGVLVDKPMGYYESIIAGVLIQLLRNCLDQNHLGTVLAPDGPLRLRAGLVRLSDVSFISWERFPSGKLPRTKLLRVAPDLAVEILSESNTEEEMRLKLQDYFGAGCRLAWLVDPESRTVRVYTRPEVFVLLTEEDSLDGAPVLPGFTLSIRRWFEQAGPREEEA
jgi:Uma2 family endonuclease